MLQPDLSSGNGGADGGGHQSQQSISNATASSRGSMQTGDEEHDRHDTKRDALEDAQRTGLKPRVQLRIQGESDQARADGESQQALRTKRPTQGIHGAASRQ